MDVIEMTVPTTPTKAILNLGDIPRSANDSTQDVQKESYLGVYVDHTQQPIHIYLHDAYYGVGGFAGDIPMDESPANGAYTYVIPSKTELQYRNRVKMTSYYNYLARFVSAQVYPVFSSGVLNLVSYSPTGEVRKDDTDAMKFYSDCTGTGTKYTSMQRIAMEELRVHDVVYYTMTRKDGKRLPSLGVYRAVDVVYIGADEDGVMNDAVLYRGHTLNAQTKKFNIRAVRFYMSGGICYVATLEAEADDFALGVYPDYGKFKVIEEYRTDSEEMLCYAHLPVAQPNGTYLPDSPKIKSIANCTTALYQEESQVTWLRTLHNLPTAVIFGDVEGVKLGAGNLIVVNTQGIDGAFPPAPQYLSVDASLLTTSLESMQFNIDRMREIAKENGVDTKTGSQAQSGDSKRYDFQATETKLRETVTLCREMNQWVFDKFNWFMNRNGYMYDITYPDSFYPEEEPQLAEYEAMFETVVKYGANTLSAELLKKAGRKILGKSLANDTANVIDSEIDEIAFRPIESVQ